MHVLCQNLAFTFNFMFFHNFEHVFGRHSLWNLSQVNDKDTGKTSMDYGLVTLSLNLDRYLSLSYNEYMTMWLRYHVTV